MNPQKNCFLNAFFFIGLKAIFQNTKILPVVQIRVDDYLTDLKV
jgi:hypothetical protein